MASTHSVTNRSPALPSELALLVADMPGVPGNLVRDHVETEDGRCAECPREVFPCYLRLVAEAAQRVIAGRRLA